jgi:hypothetical protein
MTSTSQKATQDYFPFLSNERATLRNEVILSSRCECAGPDESQVPSYLRLDGIQPSHLHLQQPVHPVEAGHPEVVNAS